VFEPSKTPTRKSIFDTSSHLTQGLVCLLCIDFISLRKFVFDTSGHLIQGLVCLVCINSLSLHFLLSALVHLSSWLALYAQSRNTFAFLGRNRRYSKHLNALPLHTNERSV
jgi:hypothetical protein